MKLILKNTQSPGDVVMLTAALRDLHKAHPGKFTTDVRTSCPALWEHNPLITPIADDDAEAQVIECKYPLIHRSNVTPHHFIHAFIQDLSEKLGVPIPATEFKGDIYLADKEKRWMSQVMELTGADTPFWIINAGGKWDYTIKWWHWQRYQEVVDHFRGRIVFVQVGEKGHYHPPLKGVIDLRGKTNLRQLVRLVYHAQGVLCGVTALMHLAAAVPVRNGRPKSRAAVVVAGGREPSQWEAYPHHQYLHTNGALRCCDRGGCWKSRTVAIGDGDVKDTSLCLAPIEVAVSDSTHPANAYEPDAKHVPQRDMLPRCLDMITSADVIRAIERYYEGGALAYTDTILPTLSEPAPAVSKCNCVSC